MAQKTENEETEFKVKEALTLCVNNCGVTGNPATNNMCQKCFTATSAAAATTSTADTTAALIEKPKESVRSTTVRDPLPRKRTEAPDRDVVVGAKREVNRCSGCRRKVGLTGFRCRCGELFCWEHRYSDRHDCSFDYKAAGREAISRENPVVKAAKIVRV